MMQVLIVDDEVHCAEGVKCSVTWEQLGVTGVFTAYSMKQAQKVFCEQEIHIVLCDVEMPKGSGLELLSWVQSEGLSPVSILLTSYATFDYAKQAIGLGCMDYLLKPVEQEALLNAFQRAVNIVKEEREKKNDKKLASYWNENERKRIHRFWREVLEQEIIPDSQVIMEQARKEHLVFNEHNCYLPILFKLQAAGQGEDWTTLKDMLQSDLQKLVFEDWDNVVLAYNKDCLLTIVGHPDNFHEYKCRLENNCLLFVKHGKRTMGISISCYVGEFRESGELAYQYQKLQENDKDNVTERPGIYAMGAEEQLDYVRPQIEQWIGCFTEGRYEESIRVIERYLDSIVVQRKVNRVILEQLFQDFMQEFYIAVGEKGIEVHLLFRDSESMDFYKQAVSSVRDFKRWVIHIIQKAASYVEMAADTDTVVNRVEKYICSHLGEDFGRTQLAEVVYLSPDYLSRIFKHETGISLSEYITGERLKQAKKLLRETDMIITDIAFEVGYGNAAYFIKVFREKNNITPAQYRGKYR